VSTEKTPERGGGAAYMGVRAAHAPQIRAITPDTALRQSRYFGLSERFWINMQLRYDIEVE